MIIEALLKEKYASLSKGQKTVADFLLKDVVNFSMTTASKIARQIDVSETTVIRLAYALDFDSFSQLQKAIQREYLKKKDKSTDEFNMNATAEQDFIDRIILKDIEIMKSLRSNLDMTKYWEAIDDIMRANVVKIVGFKASYSAAHWLYLKLNMMRNNVELISSNRSNYPDDLLIDKDKNVVVIFVSFPRYVAESLLIAESVKKQGAKLITVTDHLLSPVSRISHISFIVQISVDSENLIPISSISSLLNILATGIEKKYEKEVMERVLKLRAIYEEKGYFLE